MGKKRWALVCALFLVSMNLRPAITSVSPLLPDIQRDLQMNGTAASLITAIPVLCMGVFALISGRLEERWGRRRVISGCLLLIGLLTGLRVLPASTAFLLLTAVLVGIGIAIAGPLLSGFIKEYFPERAGFMVGIYTLGMGAGASLGAGLAIPVEKAFSGNWRVALAVWSILAVAALAVWLMVVRNETQHRPDAVKQARLPWGNGRAWLITLFFGLQSALFYAVTAWLAPYLQHIGFSPAKAGGTVTIFSLLQMLFCFITPILSGNTKQRRPWLLASSLLTLAGFLLLALFPDWAIWLAILCLSSGLGGLFPLALLLPLDETVHSSDASVWTAMASSVGYAIGSIGPLLIGLILDATGRFSVAFMSLACVCTGLLFISLFLGKRSAA